jgi:hypothetical protein
MKTLRKLALAIAVCLMAAPAFAGPAVDTLLQCLADNTTGRDRKDLARWMFVAMAAHPEMHDLSTVTPATGDQVSQTVGVLLTRLMTDTCRPALQAAVKAEGREGVSAAFESLGKLAMQELLTNKEVRSSLMGFDKYVDRKKLESAFTP